MDAQRFLAEFGHFAGAPGGVQQLRDMILSLAFQGQLCPLTGTPVDNLLTSIQTQDDNFIGKRRTRQSLTEQHEIINQQGWFSIPKHWQWVNMQKIGHAWGQKTPDNDFIYIDVSSIDNNTGLLKDSLNVLKAADAPSRARKIVRKDTVIYSTVRPYLLNIAVIDDEFNLEAIASTAFAIVHPWDGVNSRYIYHYLRSPFFTAYVKSVQIGMAYPAISDEKFYAGLFPLPPTDEQTRIVAKVDELMALCDKLESQQQSKQNLARLYRFAALNALTIANSPDEIYKSWIRVQNSLNLWANETQAIDEFRNVIGALAFRGILTEGYSIEIAHTNDDSLPELPVGWKWETLGSLTEYITSGSRGWKTYLKPSGDIFIRSQDIKQDALIFDNRAFVSLPEKVEGKRTLVQPDDLLLTITGGNVGKCAQVPILNCKAYVSQHVALMRLKNPSQSKFLHFWMTNAYGGRKYLARYIYGDKPGLNLSQVANVPVPLPPSDIQEKIVKQLRHYKILCDQLITQSQDAARTAELFAAASVSVITGIRTEEEEEALKTPKTELISKLRLANSPSTKEQAPLAAILARHQSEMSAGDLWQRYGGEIDAFYAQLKQEVGKGWIAEPAIAEMRETEAG